MSTAPIGVFSCRQEILYLRHMPQVLFIPVATYSGKVDYATGRSHVSSYWLSASYTVTICHLSLVQQSQRASRPDQMILQQ